MKPIIKASSTGNNFTIKFDHDKLERIILNVSEIEITESELRENLKKQNEYYIPENYKNADDDDEKICYEIQFNPYGGMLELPEISTNFHSNPVAAIAEALSVANNLIAMHL